MLTAALLALTFAADAGVPKAPQAVVVLASTPEALERWAVAKPADRAAGKGLTDKVKINERTALAVALEGYELPRSRKVDVTADLTIIDSTGRTVVEKASAAVARSYDPKAGPVLLLKPFGVLLYGVTDPEGTYTVKLTVWDQVRGDAYRAVSTFTVTR